MLPFDEHVLLVLCKAYLPALCKAYLPAFYDIVHGASDDFVAQHTQSRTLRRQGLVTTSRSDLDARLKRCNILDLDNVLKPGLGDVYFGGGFGEIYIRIDTTTNQLPLNVVNNFLPNAHAHVLIEPSEEGDDAYIVRYSITDEVPSALAQEGRCFTHSEQRACALEMRNGEMTMSDCNATTQPKESNGEACRQDLIAAMPNSSDKKAITCTTVAATLLDYFGKYLAFVVERYNHFNACRRLQKVRRVIMVSRSNITTTWTCTIASCAPY